MRFAHFIAAILAALCSAGAPALATPTSQLRTEIETEAARLAIAPAVAFELEQALSEDFERREAMLAGADAPTDRALFVGPKRAWIIVAEYRRLEEAEAAHAAYRAAGVKLALLALRDGGYELALWPRPVGPARRALQRWRKTTHASGGAPRLSNGAHYLALLPQPLQK